MELPPRTAALDDERGLLSLAVTILEHDGRTTRLLVELRRREAPEGPFLPFLSVGPLVESVEGVRRLAAAAAEVGVGDASAVRMDPEGDGLSLELKRGDGAGPGCEVVLWLDLVRWNPLFKARASRGRHQGGLRFFAHPDRLIEFAAKLRASLDARPAGIPVAGVQ